MLKRKFAALVLDFMRPAELFVLLKSLRENIKMPLSDYRIVCMGNGGTKEYQDTVYSFYRDNLIDDLVIKKENSGGGAHEQLFHYIKEDYCIQLQSDHELIQPITNEVIDYFTFLLKTDYKCVDLSGMQSGEENRYSERANFISKELYRSFYPLPSGNPGPFFNKLQNNEEFIQNKFKENNWKIAHIQPLFFKDCGKWSVREHEDGSITKHSTDEKRLFIIKKPTKKMISLDIDDDTWEKVLSGNWKNGDIPNNWKKHSFKFWN